MKIIIFAGGSGRRLWPISRQRSPKQFEPIIGNKSTLRLTVERFMDTYGAANLFISTNERYLNIVRQQLPELAPKNFIGEPERRDLAAAVGLAMLHVHRQSLDDEPVAIIWGDNYMNDEASFLKMLDAAGGIIKQKRANIVFLGETPRFANNNLGWIGIGEEIGQINDRPFFAFRSWNYRPPLDECELMFASGDYVWNTGYFVTTPGFVLDSYAIHQPEMWSHLNEIGQVIGHESYDETLRRIYSNLEVISFDDAVVQYIPRKEAVVLHGKMGWSDPGTLYALKEAINPDVNANVEKGRVKAHKSKDCLLYNYDENKLLAVAGLEGMVVVNTEDAIVVVHKDHISLVKELVDDMAGTDLEKYS